MRNPEEGDRGVPIRIFGDLQGVTACWSDEGNPLRRASVDLVRLGSDDEWWVTRAVVQAPRGNGIGSQLLQAALKRAVELGATRVQVSPGGYTSTPEQQIRFYEKNGFTRTADAWEWFPR